MKEISAKDLLELYVKHKAFGWSVLKIEMRRYVLRMSEND